MTGLRGGVCPWPGAAPRSVLWPTPPAARWAATAPPRQSPWSWPKRLASACGGPTGASCWHRWQPCLALSARIRAIPGGCANGETTR
eukprot:5770599-Pyramimonas_sp.AAC.1